MATKNIVFLLTVLAVVSTVFAAVPYEASINVTPTDVVGSTLITSYRPGETLTIYGFIKNTGTTAYPLSSMKLKIYQPGILDVTYIYSQSINFLSDTENIDGLLLSGAYTANTQLPRNLADGNYSVQILINDGTTDEVIGSTKFSCNASISRNSTITVSSTYPYAGSYFVEYVVTKSSILDDLTYTTKFFAPTVNGIGATLASDSFVVGSSNRTVNTPSFANPFVNGANILIITSNGENTTTGVIDSAMPYVSLFRVGNAAPLSSNGEITLFSCTAKEEASRDCTFTVRNIGTLPASYRVTSESSMRSTVSLSNTLIQPGSSMNGTVTITAARGDSPSKQLTLKLYHGSTLVDTETQPVIVESRDLISRINITSLVLSPNIIHPGSEVIVTVKISNTGDFSERVQIQYVLGDVETKLGTVYTLAPRQNKTITINILAPDEELLSFEVDVLKEDIVIAGKVTNMLIEPYSFTPFVDWTNNFVFVEQGNSSSNGLKLKNSGNNQDYFEVTVFGEFASLNQRVLLNPDQTTILQVPILVSQSASIGPHSINATICSLTSGECITDLFTVTVLEITRDRTILSVDNTEKEISGDEGAVFTINVENYEGEIHAYKLNVGEFNGELQTNPAQLILLNGQTGKFYIFAKPTVEGTSEISYAVLRENEIVGRGNLTIRSRPAGLTGFFTLSNAGDIGLIVFGALLIAGLVYIGVKSYTQSKVELKYWK